MTTSHVKRITPLVLAPLVVALCIWLLATRHPDPTGTVRATPPSSQSAARIQPQQLAAFSILRTSSPEPLSARLQARMESAVDSRDFGLMYEFAQETRTPVGVDAWVIPGAGYICVMRSPKVVAGCNTTIETIERGMSVVAIDPPAPHESKRYVLLGIAPDGIEKVAVKGDNGSHVTVPVIDNVYAYRASTMIHATLVRRSQKQTEPLGAS